MSTNVDPVIPKTDQPAVGPSSTPSWTLYNRGIGLENLKSVISKIFMQLESAVIFIISFQTLNWLFLFFLDEKVNDDSEWL